MKFKIFLYIYVIILNHNGLNGEKCLKSDFELQYTECDKTGHRWLVSVPMLNKSCDASSEFSMPKVARNCGKPCSPGTYLNIESQTCDDCKSGTYSQGDTVEINYWPKLPSGFYTLALDSKSKECDGEKWIGKGDFITASVVHCESFLSFTASLYEPGKLEFEYQMQGDGAFFQIKVTHDECQASATNKDKDNINTIKFMDPTTESSWNKKFVSLKKGRNVIMWTVSGVDSERSVVKINNLKITKSLFSSQCNNCSVGYYSSKRSSICSPCAMNSYSDRPGSDQCKPCASDQYSMPGSKLCIKKASCTTSDFSYKWTDCSKSNQRKKTYLWIEPKLCSDTAPDSVKLPVDSPDMICESCPKGTFFNASLSRCQFCPFGSVTDESGLNCTKCSANTKPISNVHFDKWSHWVPNLTSLCYKGLSEACKSEESWMLNGDHLQSSLVSDVHFLRLEFQTTDTFQALNTADKAVLSFSFSMNCSGYCIMYLFLKKDHYALSRLNTWSNTTARTEYRHDIPLNTSGRLVWYFTHNKNIKSAQKSTDNVKIYTISLTNVKDAGATQCRNCDPKSLSSGCLNCDKGKYFSTITHQCNSCPVGHILLNHPSQSIKDCVPCGLGLISSDGTTCQPNTTYISLSNNVYDLRNLKGHHLLRGLRLFNTHDQEYVHVFNVTLFSDHDRSGMSMCRNNISSKDGVVEVLSPVCRVTIVADKSKNNTLFSLQTISLAERYQNVSQSNDSVEYWKQMNDSLINNGFDGDSTGMDLHVYMSSDKKTDICVNGRTTVVTIRCDIKATETQFLLPSKCPVETCDGCNFHFFLKSQHACPYCRVNDFNIITEECINGHQKRHFQAPNYCVLGPGSKSTVIIKCPLVTMRTGIIVIATFCVLVFLIGLVIYCYKQNKKLEYKYMRLISGNDDNENILEGSESCGIHDGDEDEDDVKIKTNSKSGKMFARFNKTERNKRDENGMETLNLNDIPDFDI